MLELVKSSFLKRSTALFKMTFCIEFGANIFNNHCSDIAFYSLPKSQLSKFKISSADGSQRRLLCLSDKFPCDILNRCEEIAIFTFLKITAVRHLWPPYVIGQPIYIFILSFVLLFFFPRLISAIAYWMSTILRHMVWPWCEFRMQI